MSSAVLELCTDPPHYPFPPPAAAPAAAAGHLLVLLLLLLLLLLQHVPLLAPHALPAPPAPAPLQCCLRAASRLSHAQADPNHVRLLLHLLLLLLFQCQRVAR
jgi:hypothetical protein